MSYLTVTTTLPITLDAGVVQYPPAQGYFNGTGKVYGVVTVNTVTPSIKKVRLFAVSSGALVKEVTSGADGSYLFTNVFMNEKYSVVGYDETGTYSDIIVSPLLAEAM